MKNDDMILMAALLIGALMYSKSKAAATRAAVTPTSPKPANTGASIASMGQYWTNLLGPVVGAAVSNGTYKDNGAPAPDATTYTPVVDEVGDNSVYWGIE